LEFWGDFLTAQFLGEMNRLLIGVDEGGATGAICQMLFQLLLDLEA